MNDKEKQVCYEVLRLLYTKGLNSPQECMLAMAYGQFLDRQGLPPIPPEEAASGGK